MQDKVDYKAHSPISKKWIIRRRLQMLTYDTSKRILFIMNLPVIGWGLSIAYIW